MASDLTTDKMLHTATMAMANEPQPNSLCAVRDNVIVGLRAILAEAGVDAEWLQKMSGLHRDTAARLDVEWHGYDAGKPHAAVAALLRALAGVLGDE